MVKHLRKTQFNKDNTKVQGRLEKEKIHCVRSEIKKAEENN